VKLEAGKELPEALASLDLKGVAQYIKSGACKRIIVMTGAGVSVAAGIPDFRTPGSGLYYNLQKYNLPVPEAIFEINFFKTNPKPFFVLAKELYPGQFDGTKCHYFVRLLQEKGLLLRNYTQNIDTLEISAGIPEDKLVFAHGSFATASCIKCKAPHTRDWVKEEVFADRIPQCQTCKDGHVKPDIVFFGEDLPERFFTLSKQDFPEADLLIVMGTSLTVFPFAGLISKVGTKVPRVLINRDPVGAATPMMLMRGHLGFDFGGNLNSRDVALLGDCQDTVDILVKELGWEEDFKTLMASSSLKTSKV
jgi:NAD-dependent deacetylase sirtuin 2